ncbi:MAG: hypothetical protein H7144_15580, partial [Burkholderiales bacterium]|nr:hypothetical protein [Phycisphaerae bacterium]
FRSGFLPRTIGALMAIAGVCYLINSFSHFLSPAFAATLTTNDPNQPTVGITLAGYWQETSEFDAQRRSVEPSAELMINQLFGYTTNIRPVGKTLNNQGRVEKIGDEILASYFRAADEKARVRVVELATFHGMTYVNGEGETVPTQSFIGWHQKGSPLSISNIFTDEELVGQMALPYKNDNQSLVASGHFAPPPGKEFGFVVEKREYTDPKLNSVEANKGHFMRFFPAYDPAGKLIVNTYIVLHDYNTESVNYDFNDNIYLISNIIPSGKVKPAKTLFAKRTDGGPNLTWSSPIDGPKIVGYNIYRSTDSRVGYTLLNDTPLSGAATNTFVDSTAVRKRLYYYQVKSVDAEGAEGQPLIAELRA